MVLSFKGFLWEISSSLQEKKKTAVKKQSPLKFFNTDDSDLSDTRDIQVSSNADKRPVDGPSYGSRAI